MIKDGEEQIPQYTIGKMYIRFALCCSVSYERRVEVL